MDQYNSQHGEVEFLVKNVKLPRKGIYVDVGAHDGKIDSNTYFFEQVGWTGICIEPDPRSYARLEANRRCAKRRVAIGSVTGPRTFYLNFLETWSGLMQADPNSHALTVDVRRLDDVLAEEGIRRIDLLSLDTEGTELDVLKTIDLDLYKPQIIIIEYNTWENKVNTESEILDTFNRLPYRKIHRTQGNLIFERLGDDPPA